MNATISLYNVSYQKIVEIDWKHAVILMINGKVSSCTEDEYVDIKTSSGIFKLPLHLVLKKYVHIPYRDVSPSRKNIFKRDNYVCQYCEIKLDTETATLSADIPTTAEVLTRMNTSHFNINVTSGLLNIGLR